MGLSFGESLDALWLRVILSTMNAVTVLITIINLYQLRKDFMRLGLQFVTDGRRLMRPFFYAMTIFPVFISGIGHYGAQYPSVAAWLFPGVSIVMALGFLWFISLMYIACGSNENVRRHLIHQDDRCGFPNFENAPFCREKTCFMSTQNAWLGLRKRRFWLYLVFVKPLLTYFQTFIVFYVNRDFASTAAGNLIRVGVLVCTFGPVQGLRCFAAAMLPLCRMERARTKVFLMQILVPMLQIEMTLIDFLVTNGIINSIGNLNAKHRGYRWMGLLYCVQMMFVAVVTGYVYQASDLINWKERQGFQWTFHSDNYGNGIASVAGYASNNGHGNGGKSSASLTEAAAANQSLSEVKEANQYDSLSKQKSRYDTFTDTFIAYQKRQQKKVQSSDGVVVTEDDDSKLDEPHTITTPMRGGIDSERDQNKVAVVPVAVPVAGFPSEGGRLRSMISRGRVFQKNKSPDDRSELMSELSDLSDAMSVRLLDHQSSKSHVIKED